MLLRDKRPTGFLRLGPSLEAPRSTEGDPPKKCRQKCRVLANSLVANETNCQPCPNKAFAGGQAVAGEVGLLCLFPFLRTTTLKKKLQTEQLLPLCSLQQQKANVLPLQSCSISRFPFISSSLQSGICSSAGRLLLWRRLHKIT